LTSPNTTTILYFWNFSRCLKVTPPVITYNLHSGKSRKQTSSGSSQEHWGQSFMEGHISMSPLDEEDAEHSHLMSILHSPSMDSLQSSDLDFNELQNNPYMKLLHEINNEAQFIDDDDEDAIPRGRPVYSRKNSIKK
jgi:hypothetical protein